MILKSLSPVQRQVSVSQQRHMFFPGTWLASSGPSQHVLKNKPKTGQGLRREGIWGKAAGDVLTHTHTHAHVHASGLLHTHPAGPVSV